MGSRFSKSRNKFVRQKNPAKGDARNNSNSHCSHFDLKDRRNGNLCINNSQYFYNKVTRRKLEKDSRNKRELRIHNPTFSSYFIVRVPRKLFRITKVHKTTLIARRLRKKWCRIVKFKKKLRKRNVTTSQLLNTLSKFLKGYRRRSIIQRPKLKQRKLNQTCRLHNEKCRFWYRKRRRRKNVLNKDEIHDKEPCYSKIKTHKILNPKDKKEDKAFNAMKTKERSAQIWKKATSKSVHYHTTSEDDDDNDETSYNETSILLKEKSDIGGNLSDDDSKSFFETIFVGIRNCCCASIFSHTDVRNENVCLIRKKLMERKQSSIPNIISDEEYNSESSNDSASSSKEYVNDKRKFGDNKFNSKIKSSKSTRNSDWWTPILDEKKIFKANDMDNDSSKDLQFEPENVLRNW